MPGAEINGFNIHSKILRTLPQSLRSSVGCGRRTGIVDQDIKLSHRSKLPGPFSKHLVNAHIRLHCKCRITNLTSHFPGSLSIDVNHPNPCTFFRNRMAIPLPKPDPAPVTIAVLSLSLMMLRDEWQRFWL